MRLYFTKNKAGKTHLELGLNISITPDRQKAIDYSASPNYFRSGVSSEIFQSLDRWMFYRTVRYVKRTHPNKPRYWRQSQYWGRLNLERDDQWVFGNKTTGMHLLKFSWFKIERHTLVKGKSSPDDSSLKSYWQHREKVSAKSLTLSKQKIAKNQGFICPKCGESLFNGEELHIHHIEPKHRGGRDNYGNLQLLHLYCHQQTHALEMTEASGG